MEHMFFNGWDSLLRVLIVGTLTYITLVVFLRMSGNRTLSKMNAFDLVVTVALGSILATVLMSKDIPFLDGALSFGLLIVLQYIVTWSSARISSLREWITGEPVILMYRGEFLPAAMQRARIAEEEIRMAVRSAGFASLTDAEAVVLETDGSFSVVRRGPGNVQSSLKGVQGMDIGKEEE